MSILDFRYRHSNQSVFQSSYFGFIDDKNQQSLASKPILLTSAARLACERAIFSKVPTRNKKESENQ